MAYTKIVDYAVKDGLLSGNPNKSIRGAELDAEFNAIAIASSAAAAIITRDESITLSTEVTALNFVGAGVTATGAGSTTTITIPGSAGASNTVLAASSLYMNEVYGPTF